MKVAVTYDEGGIFQHFGHTKVFKVYDIEDGRVVSTSLLDTGDEGHCALSGFLKESGIDTLICGGIGGGAIQALAGAGVTLYGGVTGSADAAVESFLNGSLSYNPHVTCTEHEGHHDHNCGHHH